jgi:hypothetical protein
LNIGQPFSANISSFSGKNEIVIRAAYTDDYNASFVLGEFSETYKTWQYNDIRNDTFYLFLDVRSQADNVLEEGYAPGTLFSVLSLIPSNLDHELTILYDDVVYGANDSHYVVLYGLSNRTDMSEFVYTDSGSGGNGPDIEAIEVLYAYPEGVVPQEVANGDWDSIENEWQPLSNITIDQDENINLPFTTTATRKHIIQYNRVEIVGFRIRLSEPSGINLFHVDFNVVESIAAERFVGQTFEAQRGIAFISDLGPQRIAIDQIGIRG